MKILVVTTVHIPLDARIHHRQIRAMLEAGAEVTYAAPWSATGTDPAAVADGVTAIDLPRARGRQRLRALLAARRTIARLGPDHDLVLLHDPELVLAAPRGDGPDRPRMVLDVHEDLPAAVRDRGWIPRALRPAAVRLARWLERAAERRLDGLLLAEASYAERLPGRPVVPNLPWERPVGAVAGTHHRVVYIGRLSTGRGAHELIALGERLAADPSAPRLELFGAADAAVRPMLERANRAGVLVWHGFVPNDRALAMIEGSVAGLAPLHDLPNYHGSMPTKVVEYLAAGIPAIVTPLPEARAIVERADAGLVVDFGDVDAMERSVRQLASDAGLRQRLGANGRQHVHDHASWDVAKPRFIAALEAVVDHRPAGGDGLSPHVMDSSRIDR